MRWSALLLVALALGGCGGESTVDAQDFGGCVRETQHPTVHTEEGVTTFIFTANGAETTASVFPSVADAKDALEAEARIGDAHDQRRRNVLYGGGGQAEAAIVACLS